MNIKTVVHLLSLSLLIVTIQAGEATESLNSSLVETNTTVTETIQNSAYSNLPEKELSHHMELLGPWNVEFNTSEELSTEKIYMDAGKDEGFMGMKLEGLELWGISLIDSMDHEVGALIIMGMPRAVAMNEEELDSLIDSVMSGFKVDVPTKTALEIDGTSGRQGIGYSSSYKRDIRAATYPYKPYYDSFYNQNVTKSIIYYADFKDANEYNEVTGSLHVERLF
ncbi:MAG TPA: hypothetical protein VLB04_12740 [Methanotrichaceae archaeon]|nr:hypothetical protein [Methanotrichaceae archaeon]